MDRAVICCLGASKEHHRNICLLLLIGLPFWGIAQKEIGITFDDYHQLVTDIGNESVLEVVESNLLKGENRLFLQYIPDENLKNLFELNSFQVNGFLIEKNYFRNTIDFFSKHPENLHFALLYQLIEKLNSFEKVSRKDYLGHSETDPPPLSSGGPPPPPPPPPKLFVGDLPEVIIYNTNTMYLIYDFLEIAYDYSEFQGGWLFSDEFVAKAREAFAEKLAATSEDAVQARRELRAFIRYLDTLSY